MTTIMVDRAAATKCVLMLAHGAGAGIDHEFFRTLVPLITSRQITVVRYNFLYMDKGSKRPDRKDACFRVISAVIDYCTRNFPEIPLFAAGKSFGGRMTSLFLSEKPDARVNGLAFLGFPLHRPKEPDTQRATHLRSLKTPALFLQGTRDSLAEMPLITDVVEKLKGAEMMVFEGADHSFSVLKRSGISQAEVFEKLARSIADFCCSIRVR